MLERPKLTYPRRADGSSATNEGNNVTIEDVRKIKRFLMSKASDMICTYCEAIENGWEDERLNLEA